MKALLAVEITVFITLHLSYYLSSHKIRFSLINADKSEWIHQSKNCYHAAHTRLRHKLKLYVRVTLVRLKLDLITAVVKWKSPQHQQIHLAIWIVVICIQSCSDRCFCPRGALPRVGHVSARCEWRHAATARWRGGADEGLTWPVLWRLMFSVFEAFFVMTSLFSGLYFMKIKYSTDVKSSNGGEVSFRCANDCGMSMTFRCAVKMLARIFSREPIAHGSCDIWGRFCHWVALMAKFSRKKTLWPAGKGTRIVPDSRLLKNSFALLPELRRGLNGLVGPKVLFQPYEGKLGKKHTLVLET